MSAGGYNFIPILFGDWNPNQKYKIIGIIPSVAFDLGCYGCPTVGYRDNTYWAIDPSIDLIVGVTPDTNASGWIKIGSGSSGGNFQGPWQSAINSPTLEDGTGIAGYYYTNISTGTHSVDFGSGLIAFQPNDNVSYGNDGRWFNAGQSGSIQQIVSSTLNQLTAANLDGTVTLTLLTGITQNKVVIVGINDFIANSLINIDTTTIKITGGKFAVNTGITEGAIPILGVDGLLALSTIPVVSIAKGGTNSSTTLLNNKIMGSVGGAIVEIGAIPANTSIASGTLQNPQTLAVQTIQQVVQFLYDGGAGTGTVTQVLSNDLTNAVITNPTTTPSIAIQTGTAVNNIVKFQPTQLDGTTQYPIAYLGTSIALDPTLANAQASLNTILANILAQSGGTGIIQTLTTDTPDGLGINSTDPANVVINDLVNTDRGLALATEGKYVKVDQTSITFNGNGELQSTGANSIFVVDPSQMRGITTVSAFDNNSLTAVSPSFIKDFALSLNSTTQFYYVCPTKFTTFPSSIIKANISFNLFAGKDLINPESFSTTITIFEKNDNNTSWSIVGAATTATLNLAINENKTTIVLNVGNSTVASSSGAFRFLFQFGSITQVGEVAMLTGLNISISV